MSRKEHYKLCMVCSKIYKNMSDHITKFHKIPNTDERYEEYVKSPPTIPVHYTKLKDGKRILLEGIELQEAKAIHEEDIQMQTENLTLIKWKREKLQEFRRELNEAESELQHKSLRKKIDAAQEEYINLRYPDGRQYSRNVNIWKTAYLDYLTNNGANNPKRSQRMAFDVFLPYEKELNAPLTFREFSQPKIFRNILCEFRNRSGLSVTSKGKYLTQFSTFIHFMLVSPDSPEMQSDNLEEETSLRLAAANTHKLEQLKLEIENQRKIMNKKKGKAMIETRKNAKAKLMS